jgi:hypothetical protein
MYLESLVKIRLHVVGVGRKTRAQFLRLPTTARIMLGLSLLAALLIAVCTAYWGKDAGLRIKVQHNLRSAQLSVWVDGDLAYSGNLIGTAKRKFGLIPAVQGSLSETLAVTSGLHQIRVQIGSDSGMQENTISGVFAHKQQRTLAVNATRADISLNWQAMEIAGTDSSSTNKGWMNRYAGTLMMTVAGSIISALTGFVLKELPKQIASRQEEAPRA